MHRCKRQLRRKTPGLAINVDSQPISILWCRIRAAGLVAALAQSRTYQWIRNGSTRSGRSRITHKKLPMNKKEKLYFAALLALLLAICALDDSPTIEEINAQRLHVLGTYVSSH
jgi:hypothetical protein